MSEEKNIALNRKAFHEYQIIETYEAGLVLTGTEIKSVREGKVSIQDAYAKVEKGEVYLINAHIAPFELGNRFNHDPKRNRKLLLHKSEIRKLIGATQARGYTLIPLKMYFKKGKVKTELALAKGKLLYDKREALIKKTAQREMQKALRYKEKRI